MQLHLFSILISAVVPALGDVATHVHLGSRLRGRTHRAPVDDLDAQLDKLEAAIDERNRDNPVAAPSTIIASPAALPEEARERPREGAREEEAPEEHQLLTKD